MTLTDIITKCNIIKPNEYSQKQKKSWLRKIESDIRTYALMYSGSQADMSDFETENPTLLLTEEFSDIYIYYIISMIDLANQEYQLYNNSAAYFNSVFSEWKKKHRREVVPECSVSVKV